MAPHRTRIDNSIVPPLSELAELGDRSSRWTLTLHRIRRRSSKVFQPTRYAKLISRFVSIARRDGASVAFAKGLRKVKKKFGRLLIRTPNRCSYFTPLAVREPYDVWQGLNRPNSRRLRRMKQSRMADRQHLLFSIVVPVYNPPLDVFRAMIESVVAQSYDAWELILVDDASPDSQVREVMEEWASRDSRIKPFYRQWNGNISIATNQAAEAASGEFIVLLDHDDLLAVDALTHLAIHLDENPGTDLVYSDDDKISEDGRRHSEQFKPDWSPELLLSYSYTGHLSAVSRTLFHAVGGMRVGFEGSQDHDFWLRASERAGKIGHIPQILYHWRVLPGSTASSGDCKPASFEAGRRAVEEAFLRRGVACKVQQKEWAASNACSIFEPIMSDEGPEVAILIPTRNHVKRLKLLIDSLKKTTYKNYRVYVIDNMSDDPATLRYLASVPHQILRIPNQDGKFSFAAINNEAVRRVNEELILFLNDDTEVINPRWLSQMVGWSRLEGVGAVGARLLFGDRTVQHAGIVHGFNGGLAGHAFRFLPWWDPGALNLARVTRNCLAVTAACTLTPRRLFLEQGGFDEDQFAVAYNDADYGYRLTDAGFRCVYCAEAELYHHEGQSRGYTDNPREVANYRKLHGNRVDPFLNPHLDPNDEAFRTKPTVVPIGRGDSPITVLGVTHNLNSEGAPRFEFELLARLKATGKIRPTVLSPCDGDLRSAYEDAGIEIRIDPSFGGVASSPQIYRSMIDRLSMSIREGGFEVVHANTLQTFWAVESARAAGVPSVWSIHESEAWQTYYDGLPPENAASALACMTYPYRVVFTARSTAQVWGELGSNHNFDLIHFALDVERFQSELDSVDRDSARRELGIGQDELCVLLVGTICGRKGQQDLPKAFGRLPKEVAARMRCVIVGAEGEPAYSRQLKDIIRSLPKDRRDRVQVVHGAKDTSRFWVAADLFCCTSRIESYPRVVLEAMAARLPVITTPVFGIAEQVRPSVNALTFQPGDTDTLARHLTKLATDEAKRLNFAEAAHWVLKGLPDPNRMDLRYLQTFQAAAESSVPPTIAPTDPRMFGGSRGTPKKWLKGIENGGIFHPLMRKIAPTRSLK